MLFSFEQVRAWCKNFPFLYNAQLRQIKSICLVEKKKNGGLQAFMFFLLCQRKGKKEEAAFALAAFDADLSAVGLDQMADDCQPESGSAAGTGAVYLVETLKNTRQGFFGDACAAVAHADLDRIIFVAG